jgi:signal transduction histidine kinase/CheY-like chemotaxis protein
MTATAREWGRTAVGALGLAAAYALTGILGMKLAAPPGNVTAVWLPAGLSLAALIALGPRVWPGITVGSFICNVLVFPPEGSPMLRVTGALLTAIGSTVGLSTIAWLMRRGAPNKDVLSTPGALARFGGWVAIGCSINATGGLVTTATLGHLPSEAFGSFFMTWWLGDAVGILLVTPLVLREEAPAPRRPVEWVLTILYTVIGCQLVFGRPLPGIGGAPLPLAFTMLLGVVWAGVRLDARAVCVQALVIYPLMAWATLEGRGPFGPFPHETGLLLIDALLVVTSTTGLVLAALSALTRSQQAVLELERLQLEARVAERTAQLEISTRSLLEETEARGKLSARLIEAQKQEALGRLAGGVAHDFNNLLTVVSGEAELMRRRPGHSPEVYDGAGAILAAAHRAGELTRQLLAVARRQPTAPRHIELAETLATNRRLLRPLFPESVTLDVTCPEICGVEIDPTLLDQIILNLALNARDAVNGKGHVKLEAKPIELDAAGATALGILPGHWVRLSVSDDGAGIAPELLERIFEPFFTTKSDGRGTGLGLSTVQGIAQQAKGTVKVTSEPGNTVFSVWLPESTAPSTPVPAPAPPTNTSVTRVTILVVEDEPLVRRTVVLALERAGHKTITASDGEEALGILRQPNHGIQLVLTDVVMPRLGGVELARALRKSQNIPVVFMSGFHERQSELVHELVLGKPFTPEQLVATIEVKLREARV